MPSKQICVLHEKSIPMFAIPMFVTVLATRGNHERRNSIVL